MTQEFIVLIKVKASDKDDALNRSAIPSERISVAVNPVQTPIVHKPIPRDQWPGWAKALAQLSKPEDKGIGDVTARMIGDEKSAKFKTWFKATFNRDCGCIGRQLEWNLKYPLP